MISKKTSGPVFAPSAARRFFDVHVACDNSRSNSRAASGKIPGKINLADRLSRESSPPFSWAFIRPDKRAKPGRLWPGARDRSSKRASTRKPLVWLSDSCHRNSRSLRRPRGCSSVTCFFHCSGIGRCSANHIAAVISTDFEEILVASAVPVGSCSIATTADGIDTGWASCVDLRWISSSVTCC